MRQFLSIVVLGLVLSGCATPYQPQGATGGYSETQLSENVFQIRFRGNGYTSAGMASDYALLRAAEITLERGFTHFGVVDGKDTTKISTYTSPTTSHTTINAYGSGRNVYGYGTTNTYGGQTTVFQKPRSTRTIVCFKGKPEKASGIIYDAEFLKKSLRGKYQLDKKEKQN